MSPKAPPSTQPTNTIRPPESHDSKRNRAAQPNHWLSRWFSRRNLLAAIGVAASATAIAATDKTADTNASTKPHQSDAMATAVAKQEIAELRCLYARATDLIGTTQPEAVAEGRQIYHRIFTPTAIIGATGRDDVTGPDAWVDVVLDALKVYEKTQHLIGTQLVEIQSLPNVELAQGRASMSSYLQAWHAKADGELWLFIGSYTDQLVHSPEQGWQISRMMLEQVSGETRQLDS